ncbi:MAG: ABC transporter permease [Anaerolineales bacterium]|nr:ABC transporter permease [Anaerolineales bacterium]
MRNVWIIAARELRHYFVSPVAYALAFMVFLILGGIFFINVFFGLQSGYVSPDGRIVMGPLVTILLFITPAITMRLIADEYRMGTIELLLTAPVRDWELVTGKWLGSMLFMLAILVVTWAYPLILHRMSTPGIDQGILLAASLGIVLMVAAMLGIGVMVSAFFRSPLAAFFVTLSVLLVLWIAGGLGVGTGVASEIARQLSFVDHFYGSFYRGLLSLPDVLYYVSLTVLALFLGAQAVEARRWG